MIFSAHFLTGSAIAKKVRKPYLAFILGVVSHFVLDAIPHLDQGTFTRAALAWPLWAYLSAAAEIIVFGIIFYYLFRKSSDYKLMLWGGLGAVSIDVLDNHPFWQLREWPVFHQIHFLHNFVHFNLPIDLWYLGVFTTIIVIGGTLWYLLKS